MHDEVALHKYTPSHDDLFPAPAGIFLDSIMKSENAAKPVKIELNCSEELEEKKLAIEKRQKKTLSALGKVVSELKSGLYKLERPPED